MKFLAAACLFLASAADGSKFSDRATRNEFVRAMERVSQEKKQEEGFYKRLLRVAKPVTPEFILERNLENDDAIEQYGLNLTDYALKYVGCQNIHTYSDELAEEGDSGTVLEMNRFVIIRLCPRNLCSNYNEFGCNSGFGDFMISMEEYLAAMADSYYNQYQEYCETCYYCKKQSQYSYSNNQNGQGDDAAAADGDDAAAAAADGDDAAAADGDDAAAADGDDAAAADGDDAAAADGDDNRRALANGDDANGSYYSDDKYNADADADADECADYADVCDSFYKVCEDYSAKATDLQDYFECSKTVYANSVAYLGPHCRSDGKTIGIGIYDDQYCNDYIGDIVDISSYTGMDIQDDYLKAYYSEECISCLASVSVASLVIYILNYTSCSRIPCLLLPSICRRATNSTLMTSKVAKSLMCAELSMKRAPSATNTWAATQFTR
jgi:hypothetical protein